MVKFIVFEGGEFSGKTTQIQMFKNRLESYGRRVLVVKNPGTTELGAHVRREVLTPTGAYRTYTEFTKAMLMLTALRSVADEIASVQLEYDYIIADRWFYTTLVYHGMSDPATYARIKNIIEMTFPQVDPSSVNFRTPTTFLLRVSTPARSVRKVNRVCGETHVNDQMDDPTHENMQEAYVSVLNDMGSVWESFDQTTDTTPEQVSDEIWDVFTSHYIP